jgi:hypothetical protein
VLIFQSDKAVHSDFTFIFAANPLETLTTSRHAAQNRPNHSALCSQMKPQLEISRRVTSEKRAAAARANGAKSRGPVTAIGRANSSRNSLRHGLRAETLPIDQVTADRLTALLASYICELQPQSPAERRLAETMARAEWRQTRLWRLETAELNRETRRVNSLALAYQSLSGDGGALDLINRCESQCDRHWDSAYDRLAALQARRGHSAGYGTFEKINSSERTQQAVENSHRGQADG